MFGASLAADAAGMTIRTLAAVLLLAVATAAAGPVIDRVTQALPFGPPPPAALPACRQGELPAKKSAYDEWADTLLDTAHRLPADYVPPDLVRVVVGDRRVWLRELAVDDLRLLIKAARREGVAITVTSGFRSYQAQSKLFTELARLEGEEQALRSVARPGHSEHQLGTAVDLKGDFGWLRDNAWRFGYVLSYPQGRSPAWTCYMAEPWHFRYVGRERAAEIRESGLSPREWLWNRLPTSSSAANQRQRRPRPAT